MKSHFSTWSMNVCSWQHFKSRLKGSLDFIKVWQKTSFFQTKMNDLVVVVNIWSSSDLPASACLQTTLQVEASSISWLQLNFKIFSYDQSMTKKHHILTVTEWLSGGFNQVHPCQLLCVIRTSRQHFKFRVQVSTYLHKQINTQKETSHPIG